MPLLRALLKTIVMLKRQEFAELCKTPIAGVERFSACLFHHGFSKHFHDAYTIGINDGGRGQFLCRGRLHFAVPNVFHLINPGEVHTGEVHSDRGWAFRNFYISSEQLQAALLHLDWEPSELPCFSQPTTDDPALRPKFEALFSSLTDPKALLQQQSLLLDFIAQLFCHGSATDFPDCRPTQLSKSVQDIKAYLEAYYSENITIDTLANLVNLSPSYLIRSFRQQIGLPPHSYQRHWQILQAKRSLYTSQSLAEIAAEHGFYDQSHLTRHFKRMFGVTPGEYRKDNFIQD